MSTFNHSPDAVLANCSRADSLLGIVSSLEAAVERRSNEDADRVIASIAFSVSDFTSTNGGVEETDTFWVGGGACCGGGCKATVALAAANAVFSANLPFGLYDFGGRSQGGVGGRSISLSSLIILIVWQLDNVPGPNVGGFTRFVAATRSKNLLSSLERERRHTRRQIKQY